MRCLTVAEHLELVGIPHGVAAALGRRGWRERADALVAEFGLGGHARPSPPEQLFSGLPQRAQMACAFVRPFAALLPAGATDDQAPRDRRQRWEADRDGVAGGG